MPPLSQQTLLWLKRPAVGFFIICALVDVFPRLGPPDFRYTGSDQSNEVWNLGWPLVLAIYDSQSGIHLGPFLYFVVPVQAAIACLIGAVLFFQSRSNKMLNGRNSLFFHA